MPLRIATLYIYFSLSAATRADAAAVVPRRVAATACERRAAYAQSTLVAMPRLCTLSATA